MSAAGEEIDRIAPTRRPDARPAGYQEWWNLLFLHWRVPVSEIQPFVPPGLTVDTWDGDAWVGLIPFEMSGVRPRWFPAVPGVSAFAEFNVRTYVHEQGRHPGVWFFSLDAANPLAVAVARWKWRLPYYWAAMSVRREGPRATYRSKRRWPRPRGAGLKIESECGDWLTTGHRDQPPGQALPGTLEHFLVERYLLYAQASDGRLFRGQVHHSPYPLRAARLISFQENLLEAAGIRRFARDEPDHIAFSDGVQVEVFALRSAGMGT